MKKITYITIMSILYSCGGDSNLGDNYYYLPKYESDDIGYPYGTIVYSSEEKNHFDKIIIYSDIEKIEYDDQFIIVLQRPNRKLMLKRIENDLNYKEGQMPFIMGDSILKSEKLYNSLFQNKENYFIIDKKKNKIFGPLKQAEFINIKTKNNIELKFN